MMQKKYLINGNIGPNTLWKNFSWPPFFFASTGVLAAGIGVTFGLFGLYVLAVIIAIAGMYLLLVFRQDELAATITIAIHLYIDWYLGLRVVAMLMILVLLLVFFLVRSS